MAITRDEILRRARAVPLGSISYSQGGTNASGPAKGYRRDCSGFVSYCWALPTSGPGSWGGYSTATFVTQGLIYEIPRDQLEPGDAIGYCGPTTAASGGGHIALWLGKSGSREHILDHGSGMGPKDRVVTWGTGTGWQSVAKLRAWRFKGIGEDITIDEGDDMLTAKHGDGGPVVEAIQLLILAANGEAQWVKGSGILPKYGPDRGYGDETARALVTLGAVGGDKTGRTFGPSEYVGLIVAIAKRQATSQTADPAVVAAAVQSGLARLTATTTLSLAPEGK